MESYHVTEAGIPGKDTMGAFRKACVFLCPEERGKLCRMLNLLWKKGNHGILTSIGRESGRGLADQLLE